jgi:uncharacterized protein
MKKVSSSLDPHQSKDKGLAQSLGPQQSNQLHSSSVLRVICVILAVLCIVLALVGVVLPGIPTFDFLFLATFFAAKGSTRLHRWLHQNRYMRLLMAQYQGGFKHISRSRKWMMSVSIVLGAMMLILSSSHLHLKLSVLAIFVIVLIWVWTRSEKI